MNHPGDKNTSNPRAHIVKVLKFKPSPKVWVNGVNTMKQKTCITETSSDVIVITLLKDI